MKPRLAPRRRRETPVECLMRVHGWSRDEAERRLAASRRAAWRMTASPEELAAEDEIAAAVGEER